MTTQPKYKIELYHGNVTNNIPTWAITAVEDMLAVLDNANIVEEQILEKVMYWENNKFLIMSFSKLTTITDTVMDTLREIGWEFYWFQDFGRSYSIEFRYGRD